MTRDYAGPVSLQRADKFTAPQSAAIIENTTVKIYALPYLIHYYLLAGFTGTAGAYTFGFPGFIGGVLLGTGISLLAQRWRHGQLTKKIFEEGTDDVPDVILKKGKTSHVKMNEGRFGNSLEIESPKYELSLAGDNEDLEKIQNALI